MFVYYIYNICMVYCSLKKLTIIQYNPELLLLLIFLCIAVLHVTVDALSWCHKIIGTQVPIFMIIIWEPFTPKPTQNPPKSYIITHQLHPSPHPISHTYFHGKQVTRVPDFIMQLKTWVPKTGGSPF